MPEWEKAKLLQRYHEIRFNLITYDYPDFQAKTLLAEGNIIRKQLNEAGVLCV